MIRIGNSIEGPNDAATRFQITTEDPVLHRHVNTPWFRLYACEKLGLPLPSGQADQKITSVAASHAQLARHTVVCGATGSGKTRLAMQLLYEQMKEGCSVVMLDPKLETILHVLVMAQNAGIKPEQVSLLLPGRPDFGGVPGWNPLDYEQTGTPPSQAASDMVSVLAQSTTSWGARMQDLLTNALLVLSTHRLSIYELARFLQRDEYREGLLAQEVVAPDPISYQEAHEYFTAEFARWGKSERAAAVAPVMNKLREFLRTGFLRSLLCAEKNTLNLSSLWQQQRLILVNLDRTTLGDEGVRLLGGMLTWQLYRTAMRTDGPVPVCLSLDEMGVSGQFIGSAVCEILAIARSRKLRLLVACQHLAQLSDELRESLLAITSVQAFFRLGYQDARLVAAALAAGTGDEVVTVEARAVKGDPKTGEIPFALVPHAIRDGWGNELRFSSDAWKDFALDDSYKPDPLMQFLPVSVLRPAGALDRLKVLASMSGIPRLYVHAADTKEPVEITKYLSRLSSSEYDIRGYFAPLRLNVRFPRPTFRIVGRATENEKRDRWTRLLMDLPTARAVVVLAPEAPILTQVVVVPDPEPGPRLEQFVSSALVASGQSLPDIEATYQKRRKGVERLEEIGAEILAGREDGASPRQARARRVRRVEVGTVPTKEPIPQLPAMGEVAEDGSLA